MGPTLQRRCKTERRVVEDADPYECDANLGEGVDRVVRPYEGEQEVRRITAGRCGHHPLRAVERIPPQGGAFCRKFPPKITETAAFLCFFTEKHGGKVQILSYPRIENVHLRLYNGKKTFWEASG